MEMLEEELQPNHSTTTACQLPPTKEHQPPTLDNRSTQIQHHLHPPTPPQDVFRLSLHELEMNNDSTTANTQTVSLSNDDDDMLWLHSYHTQFFEASAAENQDKNLVQEGEDTAYRRHSHHQHHPQLHHNADEKLELSDSNRPDTATVISTPSLLYACKFHGDDDKNKNGSC